MMARSFAKRECPKCGYGGDGADTCPECGCNTLAEHILRGGYKRVWPLAVWLGVTSGLWVFGALMLADLGVYYTGSPSPDPLSLAAYSLSLLLPACLVCVIVYRHRIRRMAVPRYVALQFLPAFPFVFFWMVLITSRPLVAAVLTLALLGGATAVAMASSVRGIGQQTRELGSRSS
ncbi:MAG: hypothetical protein H6811_09015 [Phycisphaeraceae bacterium]|nr:hypothetical protein [Phycisphaeraceae bacterium]